jgi:Holliday junction resolvase RusA-like endonuclease
MKSKLYKITPAPKPRMTQRDRWKRRPVVQRYNAFKDQVRLLNVKVPEYGAHVIFHIPMPRSWSIKKCRQHHGQPHQQKPDIDNLLKGLLDAVYQDDSVVFQIKVTKIWMPKGAIEIEEG